MRTTFLLPIFAILLAGCVNLHVHFPEAAPGKAAGNGAAPAGGTK